MEFGEKLRSLREKNGYTLDDVETNTGIAKSYLSRLERGVKTNLSMDKGKVLADFFNVPLSYLYTDIKHWKDLLPPELQDFVAEENIDYLEIGLTAKEKGITPEMVSKVIELFSQVKGQK